MSASLTLAGPDHVELDAGSRVKVSYIGEPADDARVTLADAHDQTATGRERFQ